MGLTEIVEAVAPVRERGLKFTPDREEKRQNGVAPVRERGLKYAGTF